MRNAIKISSVFVVILFISAVVLLLSHSISNTNEKDLQLHAALLKDSAWEAPSLYTDLVTSGKERAQVIYGEDLIANTAKYLGPKGSIAQISNGMNCQNCHLDAGKRAWGNNFGAVYSTYPKYRERSGSIEDIHKRINDCFVRSLNGQPLDTNTKEMEAMYAYIKWVGKGVAKGVKPYGSALGKLNYLDRAASPDKGKNVYTQLCQRCHGERGEGQLNLDSASFATPPLWGINSYNDGAGLYRLSSFAVFVKYNMPFNIASRKSPALTDEEAWDVAAFVNSQPRPHMDQRADWPDMTKKPIDFPFGPYADPFTQHQHQFGPFKPIEEWKKLIHKELALRN
ncbi:c-type cytochrome [Flavisolibacter tropicus]|uniref:c-type cytochrome n=1 Tax=Flavisolibacter tropicus TaxID=1492898 RepID=UPI0009EE5D4E|nr:c-type cytochrome [Flavisolibacter tropicus]